MGGVIAARPSVGGMGKQKLAHAVLGAATGKQVCPAHSRSTRRLACGTELAASEATTGVFMHEGSRVTDVVAALSACLAFELDRTDHDALVGRLGHVIEGQCGG